MAHLLTLVAPAAFKRHEGVGALSGEQASEEGVFWFVLSALPLAAAWLVAEFWFTSPSFSGNVFAFAATWAGFELTMRGAIRLVTRAFGSQ
jgi:hypothetical protein